MTADDDAVLAAGGTLVYYCACAEALDAEAHAAALALLDGGERARMARFRFERDRLLYLQAHALTRRALARHTGVAPAAFVFEAQAQGRPEIRAPRLPRRLRFNLSHTEGMAAVALCFEADVGVDVEYRARRVDIDALLPRVLSQCERDAYLALPAEARRTRFFAHWTLKEAYIKAVGKGLSLPLGSITTRPPAGDLRGEAGLELSGIEDDATRYRLRLHCPGEAHQLAVVVAADAAADIRFIRWS